MDKYHLSHDGPKICRATKRPCPIGGMHYQYKEDADNAYLREQSGEVIEKPIKRNKNIDDLTKISRDALSSSLKYNGEYPEWFTINSEIYEKNNITPPKIIDRISMPDGREVAVTWEEVSSAPTDVPVIEKGMKISKLSYRDWTTGETVGYLRTSVITNESFERAFGKDEFTPFRAFEEFSGQSFQLKDIEFENDDKDYLINQYSPINYCKTRTQNVDEKELKKEIVTTYKNIYILPQIDASKSIDEQFMDASANVSEFLKDKTTYHKIPFVDYSFIDDNYRGKGIGASLYIYSARMLGNRGEVLRGSGIQTEYAKKFWNGIKSNGALPVKTALVYSKRDEGELNEYYCLDFRENN